MARLLYPGRIATFREQGAKDKAPRKKKTLLGSIAKGAGIGIGAGIGAGALLGAYHGASGRGAMAGKGLKAVLKDKALGSGFGARAALPMIGGPAALLGGTLGGMAYGMNRKKNQQDQASLVAPPKRTLRSYLPKLGGG